MENKHFFKVTGLTIIFLIVFFIAGCGKGKDNELIETEQSGDKEESTQLVEETGAEEETKVYTNEDYEYSFIYPTEAIIVDIPVNSPQGPVFPYVNLVEIRDADSLNPKFAWVKVALNNNDESILAFAKKEQKVTLNIHPDMIDIQEIVFKSYPAVQVSNTYEPYLILYFQVKDKIYILGLNDWRGDFNSEDYKFFQNIISTFTINES